MKEDFPTHKHLFLCVGIAALLAFAPALPIRFLQDDLGVIIHNPDLTVSNIPTMAGKSYWGKVLVLEEPWRPGHYLYRPLPVMMFAVEKALFGMTAWPYRIINLLFHALCSVLVALLCARLLGGWKEAGRVSLFAGLVFAVHAVHFEPVVHIVGRAEIGMTVATLAAFLCIDRARTDTRWVYVMIVLGLAATLFKEQGLLGPGLVGAYWLMNSEPGDRKNLMRFAIGTLAWVVIYLIVREWAIDGYGPTRLFLPLANHSFGHRAAIMSAAFLKYIQLTIVPWEILLNYHHIRLTAPDTMLSPIALLGLLATVGIIAGSVIGYRKNRPDLMLGFGFIIIGLGPASNVFFPVGLLMAERLLYLPTAGVCLLIAAILKGRLGTGRRMAISVIPLLLMVALCWNHTWLYKDPLRVAVHYARNYPKAPRLQEMAGMTFETYKQFEEARACYLRQRMFDPESKRPDINMARGTIQELQDMRLQVIPMDEARKTILTRRMKQEMVRLKQFGIHEDAAFHLGKALYLLNRFDEAKIEFLNAVHNSEGASGPRREAARLLLDMERFKFGQNRLLPDLIDELEAVLAGDL